MTWLPSRYGRVIELVDPSPDQVDFADIAWSLAHIIRYVGHGERPVSVALHTLIGLEICPAALRPWWLLHDAEESRTGDMATPVHQALVAIATEAGGIRRARAFEETWAALRLRHEGAIHLAAGLDLPSYEQRAAIKQIDLVALATEHRDFHAPSERNWWHEERGIRPRAKVAKGMPADKAADALHAAFRQYLPALQPAPARASISAIRPTRRRA